MQTVQQLLLRFIQLFIQLFIQYIFFLLYNSDSAIATSDIAANKINKTSLLIWLMDEEDKKRSKFDLEARKLNYRKASLFRAFLAEKRAENPVELETPSQP